MKRCFIWSALGLSGMLLACSPTAGSGNAVNNAVDSSVAEPVAVEKVDSDAPMNAVEKVISAKESYGSFKFKYPEFGNARIDATIAKLVEEEMEYAKQDVEKRYNEDKENFPVDELAEYAHLLSYEIVQAKKDAVDIVFIHEGYTGGAHGFLFHQCISLDADGNPVDPWAILGMDEATLNRVSEISRKQLREKIEDPENIADMIDGGTEPEFSNFKNIVRTEDGFRIYFDPYSVAPWAVGVLYVDIPKAD